MGRVDDPDVAVVAVWSISRLARSVPDLYALLERFQRAGIAFVSAKESIDTSNACGRAFLGFLAVLAQFERELTSERIAANLERVANEGRLVGALPVGYKRNDEGEVVIEEPAAKVIRALFEEYATGRHSLLSLAMWAQEKGLPFIMRGRGHAVRHRIDHWSKDSVREILDNMRYTGRFVYRERKHRDAPIIQGAFSPIIEWDLWQRTAQIRRANRRDRLVSADKRQTRYALTGMLVCGTCGDTVRGDTDTSNGKRGYRCRRHVDARACAERQASADALEDEVASWLRAVQVKPEWKEEYRAARGKSHPVQTPAQRAKAIVAKIERLRISFESGARDEASFRREVAALRQELEQVKNAAPVAEAQNAS